MKTKFITIILVIFNLLYYQIVIGEKIAHWNLHVIDNTSMGADGVKLADLDGDGLDDIVVGWEQGNVARLYFNSVEKSDRWKFITVPAPDVEDAQPVDLDGDGFYDIVTCSEGEYMRVTVHWAPSGLEEYKNVAYWDTRDVPVTIGRTKWMFVTPMDVDGKYGIDLIVGSREPNGTLGWLQSPQDPRNMDDWQYHEISLACWIMTIDIRDVDHDGLMDVLVSDQMGNRGVRWLKNPGLGTEKLYKAWDNYDIGMKDDNPLFLGIIDRNDNGLLEVYAPNLGRSFTRFIQLDKTGEHWKSKLFLTPDLAGGYCKSIAIGDIDLDGSLDLVTTYGNAQKLSGVMWSCWDPGESLLVYHDVSGPVGVKYDYALLEDMDGDGDLDILTCEEAENATQGPGLGVVWYENPRL